MEQTDDNVCLMDIAIWSKPGQVCRLAPIAANVMVVCVLASCIGGAWLSMGNPHAALELPQVESRLVPKPP